MFPALLLHTTKIAQAGLIFEHVWSTLQEVGTLFAPHDPVCRAKRMSSTRSAITPGLCPRGRYKKAALPPTVPPISCRRFEWHFFAYSLRTGSTFFVLDFSPEIIRADHVPLLYPDSCFGEIHEALIFFASLYKARAHWTRTVVDLRNVSVTAKQSSIQTHEFNRRHRTSFQNLG